MGDSDQQQQLRMMGLQAEAGQQNDHQGGTPPSADALQQQGNAAILRMMGAPSGAGQEADHQQADAPKQARPGAARERQAPHVWRYIIVTQSGVMPQDEPITFRVPVSSGYGWWEYETRELKSGTYWYDGRNYHYRGPSRTW